MIRVLLADDDRTLREALAEALEDHPGIEVVGHAADGDIVGAIVAAA
jgi:DNA-binding NarL/FixJ family response regulator